MKKILIKESTNMDQCTTYPQGPIPKTIFTNSWLSHFNGWNSFKHYHTFWLGSTTLIFLRSCDPNIQYECSISKIMELIEAWFDIHCFSYPLYTNKDMKFSGSFTPIDTFKITFIMIKICRTLHWVLVNFSSPHCSSFVDRPLLS